MNPICPHCNNTKTIKRGQYDSNGNTNQRYKCTACSKSFSEVLVTDSSDDFDDGDEIIIREEIIKGHESFFKDSSFVDELKTQKRIIVTSVQNNTRINSSFFGALKQYSFTLGAKLLVIPIRYRTISSIEEPVEYPEEVKEYLMENRVHFDSHNLVIDGSIRIQATAENPLSGLDPLSKGKSLIIGHAQVQLKTLPRLSEKYPAILTTTGSMSVKNYSSSKAGQKAEFNHSMSALIIELDDGCFHIRHLNYDEVSESFCDLDVKVTSESVEYCPATAIVTGDEHVVFNDSSVKNATYGKLGLVDILNPEFIVRHDVLDSYSISHHHSKSLFTQYTKQLGPLGCLKSELDETIGFINNTTPKDSTSVIVQSNHNEHLLRWLNEYDPKKDTRNARIYHYLMYGMYSAIDASSSTSETKTPDPFQMYASPRLTGKHLFPSRTGGIKIHGIECGAHGDIGNNGSRGSRATFAILPQKTIIGHSHSPGIEKGCYQVGTSSTLKLEYTNSASSWHHAHCIIHANGKRQLIFITNGKFKM